MKGYNKKLEEFKVKNGDYLLDYKAIKGYDGYFVHKNGYIYSLAKEKILKSIKNGKGYFQVSLYSNGKSRIFLVHRLVATAFVDNPENKVTVNHKDGDKENNTYINLEWATYGENNVHALKNKLRINNYSNFLNKYGGTNYAAVPYYVYDKDYNLINEFETSLAARNYYNISYNKLKLWETKQLPMKGNDLIFSRKKF